MQPKTLNTIAGIAIVVIVLSLLSMGLQLTGYAVDTAVVNVTVSTSEAINFTTDFLDFGAGIVNLGQASATVNSEGTVTNGNWSEVNGQLVLENIGNQNVSLAIKSDKDAAAYLGGTSPSYKFKIVQTEANSCEGASAATYTEITTGDDEVCTNFPFDDSKDLLAIEIELTIPSDSNTGEQTSTITATGSPA